MTNISDRHNMKNDIMTKYFIVVTIRLLRRVFATKIL